MIMEKQELLGSFCFFFVGKYKDEVLCDVVPIHATYLLLGRPLKF